MKLVKVGGIIAFDNTLWFGFVAEEEETVPVHLRVNRKALMELNKRLASDPRIEISQVSIGDGVTLCRRESDKKRKPLQQLSLSVSQTTLML